MEVEKTESIYHIQNILYLYLLNKYIICNFRGYRCGTTPIGVVRLQRVNVTHPRNVYKTEETHEQHVKIISVPAEI